MYRFITSYETLVDYHTPEIKEQWKQWIEGSYPAPKKALVVWDSKRILLF